MKTLVILSHPDIENSRINKTWKKELENHPEEIQIHELYKEYPDWNIDVKKEQELLEKYDKIILEFPIYWYNCPPLLKKWLDEVWTFGWAYGPEGNELRGKRIGLAVSAGGLETNYTLPLAEILSPFKASINYVSAEFASYFVLFGTVHNLSDEKIAESTKKYIEYIKNIK